MKTKPRTWTRKTAKAAQAAATARGGWTPKEEARGDAPPLRLLLTPKLAAEAQAAQKITERALIKRINRKLARQGEVLCKAREGSRDQQECDAYYVVGVANGSGHWRSRTLLHTEVGLEALGRELNALGPDESLVDETLAAA